MKEANAPITMEDTGKGIQGSQEVDAEVIVSHRSKTSLWQECAKPFSKLWFNSK
jgi:hypothetical protein